MKDVKIDPNWLKQAVPIKIAAAEPIPKPQPPTPRFNSE